MTTTSDWTSSDSTALFEAVLALETPEEAARFFRDLCTIHEIDEFSQRWAIARKLDQGLPYRRIAEETASSTATVTRINQWLKHGTGGYRLMLDRLGSTPPKETP